MMKSFPSPAMIATNGIELEVFKAGQPWHSPAAMPRLASTALKDNQGLPVVINLRPIKTFKGLQEILDNRILHIAHLST